jgi:phosphatidylserine decarboxylase
MLGGVMHSGKAFKAAMKMTGMTLVILAALLAFGYFAYQIGAVLRLLTGYLVALWLVFVIFVLYFFRDPDPIAPSAAEAVVAPGHGKVDLVDETTENEVMSGPCRRVSIFLSVFDVHVQNAPVQGKVIFLQHKPGLFLNAMRTDCADHNENVLIGFELSQRPGLRVGVRLIAGLIARRIIPWIHPGEVVARSQRISLIQFGSRVNLYLPLEARIQVKPGDRVVGGQTVLATLPGAAGAVSTVQELG